VVKFYHYQEGDVFRINLREGDTLGGVAEEVAGPAWSMKDEEGNVLLSFGILPSSETVGNLWAFISDDARGHGIKMIKFGRAVVEHGLTEKGFRRIQSIVRADRPEYQRFTEALGFTKEGLMRKAAPNGDDLWLYSRVSE